MHHQRAFDECDESPSSSPPPTTALFSKQLRLPLHERSRSSSPLVDDIRPSSVPTSSSLFQSSEPLEHSYLPYQHQHQRYQLLAPYHQPHFAHEPHRLLPSVVYHSPHASPTPRLPPLSTLTSAASLRRRELQPHPLSSVRAPLVRHSTLFAEENLCRYRNKRCGNPRAIKRNSDRHNLCEKHRAKANQNQRKLESKRRTQKKVTTANAAPQSPRQETTEHSTPLASQLHHEIDADQSREDAVAAWKGGAGHYRTYSGMYVPAGQRGTESP